MLYFAPVHKCSVERHRFTLKNAFNLVACLLASTLMMPSVGAAEDKKTTTESVKATRAGKLAAKPKKAEQSKSADEEAQVKQQLAALKQALAEGDAAKTASMWTEDGTYTSYQGEVFKGNKEILARFTDLMSQEGKPLVYFALEGVKKLAPGAALAEGIVHRMGVPSAFSAETRFSIVFVKQGGNWLIKSASETPYTAPVSKTSPLSELSWLVGDWAAKGKVGSIMMKVDWAANKNFLICTYFTKQNDGTPIPESRQVIGWDPRSQSPISWHFDARGGFGFGQWNKRSANKWLVQASGVDTDGSETEATNVLSIDGKDSFSWQSIDRTINGEALSDTAALQVQRLSK